MRRDLEGIGKGGKKSLPPCRRKSSLVGPLAALSMRTETQSPFAISRVFCLTRDCRDVTRKFGAELKNSSAACRAAGFAGRHGVPGWRIQIRHLHHYVPLNVALSISQLVAKLAAPQSRQLSSSSLKILKQKLYELVWISRSEGLQSGI